MYGIALLLVVAAGYWFLKVRRQSNEDIIRAGFVKILGREPEASAFSVHGPWIDNLRTQGVSQSDIVAKFEAALKGSDEYRRKNG